MYDGKERVSVLSTENKQNSFRFISLQLFSFSQTLSQTHNMNKPKKTCVVEAVNPKAVTG